MALYGLQSMGDSEEVPQLLAALADKVRVSGSSMGNRGAALLDLRAKLRPSSITIEEIFRPLLNEAIERWEALPGPVQRTRAAFTDGSMYFPETPFARCGYSVHFHNDDWRGPRRGRSLGSITRGVPRHQPR